MQPYYADDLVTLYHGDCREVTAWLDADVLVTDPPYGRAWRQGTVQARSGGGRSASQPGIQGDTDTYQRDRALEAWGDRLAIVFGDPMLPPPPRNKLTMAYRKPSDAGARGAIGGFRRDLEVIYLIGPWSSGLGGCSSLLTTTVGAIGHYAKRHGHPHAKPVDVMETLISACPPGVIADPFAGSGSTLVAARNLGRHAVGVEVDESYAERAARRLAQGCLVAS